MNLDTVTAAIMAAVPTAPTPKPTVKSDDTVKLSATVHQIYTAPGIYTRANFRRRPPRTIAERRAMHTVKGPREKSRPVENYQTY